MNAIRQVVAVTLIGLRAIPQRLGPSLVIVVGMASVVAVTISILSMATGFMRTVNSAGRPDRALVLSRNSQFENASSISRDNVPIIADAPGVRRGTDGKPLVSAETLVQAGVVKKSDGLDAFITVRGVGPEGFALRPEIKLISGRMFRPATRELIVGKAAQTQFEGLDVGSAVSLPEGDWTITGSFESGGDGNESQLFADSETVLSSMRANAFKSVTVLLTGPDAFTQFRSALLANPMLTVDVIREPEYLAVQTRDINYFLTLIAYLVGGIMGLGALFGALNTLYSAVSTRSKEIATLRVFGFGATAILTLSARRGLAAIVVRGRDRGILRLVGVQRQFPHRRKPGFQAAGHAVADRRGCHLCLCSGADRRPVPGAARRAGPGRRRAAR